MKKLILISAFALLTVIGYSQLEVTQLIFDVETMTEDTMHYYDQLGLQTPAGIVDVQIVFENLSSADNFFDAGTAMLDTSAVSYAATAGEISFPVVLDTTTVRASPNDSQLLFSRYEINGKRKWNFTMKFEHDRGFIVYTFYKGSLTEGKIYRVRL